MELSASNVGRLIKTRRGGGGSVSDNLGGAGAWVEADDGLAVPDGVPVKLNMWRLLAGSGALLGTEVEA